MDTIGNKIKELRKERKLTQKELAKFLNVSQSSVCEWEKEEYEPTATAIKNIAIFFDVTADYLLGLEDDAGGKTYNNYGIHNGNVKF